VLSASQGKASGRTELPHHPPEMGIRAQARQSNSKRPAQVVLIKHQRANKIERSVHLSALAA